MWYNITDLQWQFQYAGPNLQNLRLLVCHECLDIPQPQLKPRILPPDPMPTLNARPENFSVDDIDGLYTDDDVLIISNDNDGLIVENSANYRGEDPLPVPYPPIISVPYLSTDDGSLFVVGVGGDFLVTGAN